MKVSRILKDKEHNYLNNGARKLRNIVLWLDDRNEELNKNKSHLQLISEFNKECGL